MRLNVILANVVELISLTFPVVAIALSFAIMAAVF